MRTSENTVSSFFYYMWNAWCEEECRIVFASVGYPHFWEKWCAATHPTVYGAAEKFYAELSVHSRTLLVNRACEVYNGSERRSSSSVVPDKELFAYIFPASRLERNATDEEILADYENNWDGDEPTQKLTPDEFAAYCNDGYFNTSGQHVRFI
ncbi:hypothetical protein [Parabacteroides distasonis]|uniref:hypothetical protein n=1 Tax=Parabacteroides distasonis TaxID=823 RepID=UPI00321B7A5F